MTFTLENDNNVIVHALEKIISYARNTQYILLAQSVWWISSIIGLQEGLIRHIDNIKAQRSVLGIEVPAEVSRGTNIERTNIHPQSVLRIDTSNSSHCHSEAGIASASEHIIHKEVIEKCELFLEQSKQERKAFGRNTPLASRAIQKKIKPITIF